MSVQIPTTVQIAATSGKNAPVPNRWTFADATARAAATDPLTSAAYASADLGKLAFQSSDTTFWRLATISPTWTAVGGGDSSLSIPNVIDAQADLSAVASGTVVISDASGLTMALPVSPAIGFYIDFQFTHNVGTNILTTSGGAVMKINHAVNGTTQVNVTPGSDGASLRLIYASSGVWRSCFEIANYAPDTTCISDGNS